ncbi:MAG TPA: hypothetical protein VIR78_09690 [Malonomonas sp.]
MIVGFNHNISYRGVGFHVQTEDSGVKSPQLVTLLYHGGTIIASQKTVYADILKVDNLSRVVEDLAKDQHKGMLRRLTKGEFDQRIIDLGIPLGPPPVAAGKAEELTPAPAAKPVKVLTEDRPFSPAKPLPPQAAEPVLIVEEPIIDKFRKPQPEQTLDALIFAYLSGADKL